MKNENRLKDALIGELLRESNPLHSADLSKQIMNRVLIEKSRTNQSRPGIVFQDSDSMVPYIFIGMAAVLGVAIGILFYGDLMIPSNIMKKNITEYYALAENLFLFAYPVCFIGAIFFMYDQLSEFLELRRRGLF